jgi:hypothetical protein
MIGALIAIASVVFYGLCVAIVYGPIVWHIRSHYGKHCSYPASHRSYVRNGLCYGHDAGAFFLALFGPLILLVVPFIYLGKTSITKSRPEKLRRIEVETKIEQLEREAGLQ